MCEKNGDLIVTLKVKVQIILSLFRYKFGKGINMKFALNRIFC